MGQSQKPVQQPGRLEPVRRGQGLEQRPGGREFLDGRFRFAGEQILETHLDLSIHLLLRPKIS